MWRQNGSGCGQSARAPTGCVRRAPAQRGLSGTELTSSSTLRSRGQTPGPFRRLATCGPSTGSVDGRVRWVSPVTAAPTASGEETDSTKQFNHCFEEFSPRLAAASPAGPALHSPMPGCGRGPCSMGRRRLGPASRRRLNHRSARASFHRR